MALLFPRAPHLRRQPNRPSVAVKNQVTIRRFPLAILFLTPRPNKRAFFWEALDRVILHPIRGVVRDYAIIDHRNGRRAMALPFKNNSFTHITKISSTPFLASMVLFGLLPNEPNANYLGAGNDRRRRHRSSAARRVRLRLLIVQIGAAAAGGSRRAPRCPYRRCRASDHRRHRRGQVIYRHVPRTLRPQRVACMVGITGA